MMKHGVCIIIQKWFPKLSIVFLVCLLFEAGKDVFSGYANHYTEKVNSEETNKIGKVNQADKKDLYTEKLNAIIENLEFLQQQGQLQNVKIPGKRLSPKFAWEGGKVVQKRPKLAKAYSPLPCELGMEPETEWSRKVTPRFQLDPKKFIYPILKNEPIDQLIGLRQAILLAIKLNRTLAMPYFHNHNYGGASQYNPALPSALKVNVEILRRFISVISVEELQQKCNGKFDVALLTGHIDELPGVATLLKAQSEVQMRMLNTLNTSVEPDFRVKFNIPTFPKQLHKGERIVTIPKNYSTIYPKETRKYSCAVHPYPLNLFDVDLFLRKAMKLPNHKLDIFKMKDEVLYSAIWYYTPPPAFVQMLATEVIENIMHAQEIEGVYNYMCLNYHKHNTEDISEEEIDMNTLRNILNLIVEKIASKDNPIKLSAIYISSPLSKQGQAKEYRENLKIFEKMDEIPVYSGGDVIATWKQYFHGERNPHESMCSLLEDDTQDVLSLVEMQICSDAAVFIRSIGSSWAANVQANRVKSLYSDLDASIKDLMHEQKEKTKKS